MKTCNICQEDKLESMFRKRVIKGKEYTSGMCKKCENERRNQTRDKQKARDYSKKWYRENTERAKEYQKGRKDIIKQQRDAKNEVKNKEIKEYAAKVGTRSMFEARIHKTLSEEGLKFEYESDCIEYLPRSKYKYIPDFTIYKKDGSKIFVETKGYFCASDRAKHLDIKISCPDEDIRFVFQEPKNKLNKNSKTRYWEWAEKHGFKWAGKEIPPEWFDE